MTHVFFYKTICLIAVLISAGTAAVIWRKRHAPGGLFLFWMMASILEWNLTGLMQVLCSEKQTLILWSKLSYLGSMSAQVFFLLFTLEYTHQQKWLTRRNITLLSIIPALTFLLAATNEYHHLIWTGFSPSPDGVNMIYHHGVWFWIIVAYINALIFFSVFLFFRFILQTRELYRRQNAALIIAILFPWVGMLVYAFGANPFPGLDLLPISFTVTGVILVYITSRMNFLDVIPIAREYLVDTMLDGLMVIDKYNRIVDINPSAMHIFGDGSAHKWIGVSAREALKNYTRLEQYLDATEQTQIEWEQTAPLHRHFDVQIFPLRDRKSSESGKMIILRDVTHHKKIENELKRTNDQLKEKLAQIEKLKDKLRDQSIRDALTGLFNRRYLDEIFTLEFTRAEQENYPLCLLILDIDHFKEFNDTWGHAHGDTLLRKLGAAFCKHFRMSDIPCRYGGDEFIIIMPHSISESALQRIEEFRQFCEALSLEQPQGAPPVTFSAGIAAYPEHAQTAEELFRLADQVLYRAKEIGRNRTCLP